MRRTNPKGEYEGLACPAVMEDFFETVHTGGRQKESDSEPGMDEDGKERAQTIFSIKEKEDKRETSKIEQRGFRRRTQQKTKEEMT